VFPFAVRSRWAAQKKCPGPRKTGASQPKKRRSVRREHLQPFQPRRLCNGARLLQRQRVNLLQQQRLRHCSVTSDEQGTRDKAATRRGQHGLVCRNWVDNTTQTLLIHGLPSLSITGERLALHSSLILSS